MIVLVPSDQVTIAGIAIKLASNLADVVVKVSLDNVIDVRCRTNAIESVEEMLGSTKIAEYAMNVSIILVLNDE